MDTSESSISIFGASENKEEPQFGAC